MKLIKYSLIVVRLVVQNVSIVFIMQKLIVMVHQVCRPIRILYKSLQRITSKKLANSLLNTPVQLSKELSRSSFCEK
jgi:hypothetical protein